MSRRISKRLGYENLEQRRLLAADLAADIVQCDLEAEPVVQCEVAMDFANESTATDLSMDVLQDVANGDQLSPRVQELDLSDGSDGVFGTLNESNAEDTFSFQTETDGTVDIVVASSFGEATTSMEVRNSAGDLVSATVTEGLDNFHTLRIDVAAGEAYELTVSSEEGVEGNYQITVGFAPELGFESTESGVVDDLQTEPAEIEEMDSAENTIDETNSEIHDDAQIDCDHPIDIESDPTEINSDETGASDDTVVENEAESQTTGESETDPAPVVEDDLIDEPNDNEVVSEVQSDVEPQLDTPLESKPSPAPLPEATLETNEPIEVVDLHADEISAESTELSLATGRATMLGQLESAGDVDTFRFTPKFDGSIDLFLADTTSESDLDLNISVYDNSGQELLDGATNEIVKLEFKVSAGKEYFVSISADQQQTGDYALIANFELAPQPADDHADSIGADATELVFEDGNWTATGELQFAEDTDAFRFTANCNETMTLSLDIASEDHLSAAEISVFDQAGELIVQGSTNDGVDLAFDTIEGVEYQILVDSINDIAMSFELTAKPLASSVVDAAATNSLDETNDDLGVDCSDDIAGCGEADLVDQFFAEVGEESSQFESMNTMSNELDETMSSLLRFARRI